MCYYITNFGKHLNMYMLFLECALLYLLKKVSSAISSEKIGNNKLFNNKLVKLQILLDFKCPFRR